MLYSRTMGIVDGTRWQVSQHRVLRHRWLGLSLASVMLLQITACTPTVQVAPSDKPITINMNIKIEHEIRVKLDKQLEDKIFSEDSGLF